MKKKISRLSFKIALRSLTRHRLRSFLSIAMISGAVCSIILFHGLTDFLVGLIKTAAAENTFGNMQIAKEKYWQPGKENRKLRMFNLDEINNIKATHPEIIRTSGRLSFFGLVSNGDTSVGSKIVGIDFVGEPNFTKNVRLISGKFFSSSNEKSCLIGLLLAKRMNVHPGENITVLTNTVDGVMNAMDIVVSGIITSGLDEIDSQTMFLPLAVTQTILDTKKVDIAVLKFEKLPQSESSLLKINQEFTTGKTLLRARSWRDLAVLYRQVDKFYSVQNRLMEMILLVLIFLGILNSVSMTVIERTGEIGTLRSFGESQSDIIWQFIIESWVLAVVAVVLGVISSWIIIQIFHSAHLTTEMPGASTPVSIDFNFLLSAVLYASSLAFITTAVATYIPARKAAQMNIVDALRKNI